MKVLCNICQGIGFALLTEYLFEIGSSESFIPSALLLGIIQHLLTGYHDG